MFDFLIDIVPRDEKNKKDVLFQSYNFLPYSLPLQVLPMAQTIFTGSLVRVSSLFR